MNVSLPFFRRPSLLMAALVMALLASAAPSAWGQESSDAAKRSFSGAADLQNEQLYEFAIAEYQDFLKRFPDDPLAAKARHYLGVCLIQEKKYDEAVAALRKVAADYPKFDLLDETLLNLGVAEYSQALASGKPDDFKAPAATFGKLIEQFPKSGHVPPALYNRAEALYAVGDKQAALAAYSRLLKEFPEHRLAAGALYGQGVTLQDLGKNDEARAAFDKYLAAQPDDPLATEIKMRKADTLFAAGDYAAAEKLFGEAAAVEGFSFADRSLLRQAESAYMQKQYAAAGKLYAEVVRRFPKSPHAAAATLAAGSCYYLVKDYDAAREWLTKAAGQGGATATEASHWIARSYLDQGQPAEALAAVEKQLPNAAEHKYYVDLRMDQADALYELPERRGESIAKYAAIAESHPNHATAATALYMAGFGSLNEGKYAPALEYSSAFLEKYPEHRLTPDVLFVAAESHLLLNQFAKAQAKYQELLAAYPDHRDAEVWMVRTGLSLRRQEKYPESIAALEPLIAELKTPAAKAEANYLLGASYFQEKQYAKAQQALAASLEADSKWRNSDDAMLLLARAYRQQNQLEQARSTIERVLAEYPNSKALDAATYYLGELQFTAKDYPAATKTYEKLLATWPRSSMAPVALYDLGWSRLNQQDFDGAEKAFSRLVSEYPEHRLAATTRFARAESRRQSGDVEGAVSDIEAFLKSEPSAEDRSAALYILGVSQVKQKKYDEAIKNLTAIIEATPDYGNMDKVRYELGWAYKEQGKPAEATAQFAALAADHPKSLFAAEALYHVGDAQYDAGEFAAASKSYFSAEKQAREAKQADIAEKAAHKLAWTYYRQDDFERAAGAFGYQLKSHPKGDLAADARFMRAESLFKLDKFAESLDVFKQVQAQMPGSADFQVLALLHAGQAAAQLAIAEDKDDEKQSELWTSALAFLNEADEKFPESAYRPDILFEKARALHAQGKRDEALELYTGVADSTAREVGARARLMAGEIRFEQKDYQNAIRDFFKVFRGYGNAPASFNPWKAQACYETGRAFEALQRPEKSVEYYNEVIRDYPDSPMAELAKQRLAALEK